MHPAIFLDRDGVIVENRANYIRTWEEVDIFDQALAALAKAAHSPYKIIIVTNQSAIGRGIITRNAAEEINQKLLEIIHRSGGRVDGLFLCPHSPSDACECRKPKPGLFLEAAEELSLDLSRSIMIGDAISDLQAGWNAGVKHVALVRTGKGIEQEQKANRVGLPTFPVFDTLSDALNFYLSE